MNNDPTPETLANRRAGMQLVLRGVSTSCPIRAGMLDIMLLAEQTGFYVNETVDYADDDDGWDDVRPY